VAAGTVQVGAFVAKNIRKGLHSLLPGRMEKNIRLDNKKVREGRGILDEGVSFNLDDLQQVLGLKDQINKIEALGCVCKDEGYKMPGNRFRLFPIWRSQSSQV